MTSRPEKQSGSIVAARKPKLAERLSARIGSDIIERGWAPGTLLGSEADLCLRYGVGRWALREAIALAEDLGLVRSRRGRNGGYYVAAPAKTAVSAGIRNYLEFSGVTPADVMAVRAVLEELMLALAARRITPDGVANLRRFQIRGRQQGTAAQPGQAFSLLEALLFAAGNEALEVFVGALAQLTIMESYKASAVYEWLLPRLLELRSSQVEAVIGGNLADAYRWLDEHMRVSAQAWTGSTGGRAPVREEIERARRDYVALLTGADRSKRADVLAQRIQAEIIEMGWPVGRHLGSQQELLEKYAVSRPVMREAIRSLEHYGVVVSLRGRGSGLKVSQPNADRVIADARRYLRYARLSEQDASEVQEALEIAAAGFAASRPDHARRAAGLQVAVQAIYGSPPGVCTSRFAEALAEACGNSILAMFLRILADGTGQSARRSRAGARAGKPARLLNECYRAIAQAVGSGDAALARRCMIDARRQFMPARGARGRGALETSA
ncbi:MAG: FadR/GntR family transcriptional regulator [Gammaproteobacteria bacterium]